MFVSASFGTFSCALLLTLHSVAADAKPSPPSARHPDPKLKTLPVEPILSGLNTGSYSVLLLSHLPTRFLLIVSAPNQKDLNGAVVFDQPLDTFNGTGATLFPPMLLKDKWPKVTGATTSDLLFTVTDSSPSSYLVIANNASIRLLNLKTSDLTVGQWGTAYSDYLEQKLPLSSSETMTLFTFSRLTEIQVTKYSLNGTSVMAVTMNVIQPIDYVPLCKPDSTHISLSYCKNYLSWTDWNITSGFVGSSFAYLVNRVTSSIIKFDQTVLQSRNQPVSFTSIPFASFWRKGVIPTTTPPPPPLPSTILVHHHSSLAIIIILIAVVLGSLFIAALVFYLLNKRASNAKIAHKLELAANEEMSKGDGKGDIQSKVAIRKSSSNENDMQAGDLHEPTQLIASAQDQEPVASNLKILKLSKRRGSGKKTPSKHPVSSGRVPSTHRSSLSRHSSVQRRASSAKVSSAGKVASGRRSPLKRQGSGKGRTASGKAASSHGYSSGKAASSHRASLKRKGSGKHRASSRKVASPHASPKRKGSAIKRRTSGKASPRKASLKRKRSLKRRASSRKVATGGKISPKGKQAPATKKRRS